MRWWHCQPPNAPHELRDWRCECGQAWVWHPEYGNVWVPTDVEADYEQAQQEPDDA